MNIERANEMERLMQVSSSIDDIANGKAYPEWFVRIYEWAFETITGKTIGELNAEMFEGSD